MNPMRHGLVFERDDMTITHEEADTLIIQQVAYVSDSTLYVEARVQSAPVRLTCHGHQECSSLTDAGQKIWSRKNPTQY